ncbi:MAG: hypothetical protein ACI92O_000328 [Colwellia sp.]
MLKSFKALLYIFLMFAIISDYFSYNIQVQLFYFYLGLVYFDCKDNNNKSLVLIIAIVEFIFYELDYFVYIISKYYLKTGPIAGDIILNCIILINMITLALAVLYRQEIMRFINKLFGLKPILYIPNKADSLILMSTRVCTYIYITFFLTNAFSVYQLMNETDLYILNITREDLTIQGHMFIKIESTLNSLRYLLIVILIFPWSKEEKSKHKNLMSF